MIFGSIFGGGSKDRKTVSKSTPSIPKFIEKPYKRLIDRAEDLAKQDPTPFDPSKRVAPLSADEQAAFDLIRQDAGKFRPLVDEAIGGTQGILDQVLGGPSTADIQTRQNPFLDMVLGRLEQDAERQFDIEQKKLGDTAQSAGAFGGSRFAVAEDELRDQYLDRLLDVQASQRAGAFDRALNQYNVDMQRGLAGQSQLANLAGVAQGQLSNQAGLLQGAGRQARQIDQGLADATFEEFMRQEQGPFQRAGFLGNILQPAGSLYRGDTNTTTQKAPESSLFGDIVGTGLSIASVFKDGGVVPEDNKYAGGGKIIDTMSQILSGDPFAGITAGTAPFIRARHLPVMESQEQNNNNSLQNMDAATLEKGVSNVMSLFSKNGPGAKVKNVIGGQVAEDIGASESLSSLDNILAQAEAAEAAGAGGGGSGPFDFLSKKTGATVGSTLAGAGAGMAGSELGELVGTRDEGDSNFGQTAGQVLGTIIGGPVGGTAGSFLGSLLPFAEGGVVPEENKYAEGGRAEPSQFEHLLRSKVLDPLGDMTSSMADAQIRRTQDAENMFRMFTEPRTEFLSKDAPRTTEVFGSQSQRNIDRALDKLQSGQEEREVRDSMQGVLSRASLVADKDLNIPKPKPKPSRTTETRESTEQGVPVEKKKSPPIKPKEQKEKTPTTVAEEGPMEGINVPLLMAGLGMLSTEGDAFDQIGAGFQGYFTGKMQQQQNIEAEKQRQAEAIKAQAELEKTRSETMENLAQAEKAVRTEEQDVMSEDEFIDNFTNLVKAHMESIGGSIQGAQLDPDEIYRMATQRTLQDMAIAPNVAKRFNLDRVMIKDGSSAPAQDPISELESRLNKVIQ